MSNENPQVVDKRRFTEEGVKVGPGTPVYSGPDPDKEARILEVYDAFSPSSDPNKSETMDFTSAIKLVLQGKRVTRLEWENPDIWLIMFYWGHINPKVPAGKYLSIHHADGTVSPLYISDGDMLGDDWAEVV